VVLAPLSACDAVPQGLGRGGFIGNPDVGCSRLNLPAIETSLRAVQDDFDRINDSLSVPRDAMSDEVRENMMTGYRYVDDVLAEGLDLFDFGSSKRLFELNALVLCGADAGRRDDCASQMKFAEKRFYDQEVGRIGDLVEWLRQRNGKDVWKWAAGAYIQILSQPQLYIEGNHRTGALVMSYILARNGRPPFVLSVDNAKAYFEPSTLVKETKKHSVSMLIRLPKLKKKFAKLLKENADQGFLMPAR
jgi:prophage maintenance system killer protein